MAAAPGGDGVASLSGHAGESARGRFGIFGTSVAATWLAGGVANAAQFFVDEDAARQGRTHLGRPILKPDQLPRGAKVYLAFAPETAEAIRRRLSQPNITFLTPPVAPA